MENLNDTNFYGDDEIIVKSENNEMINSIDLHPYLENFAFSASDIFPSNLHVELQDGKSSTNWIIIEKKFYHLITKDFKGDTIYESERRFSDFEWLYRELTKNYPGILFPSLPDKAPLAKVRQLKESNECFMANRKKGLQQFIDYILCHPVIKNVPELKKFFSEDEEMFEITKKSGNSLEIGLGEKARKGLMESFKYLISYKSEKSCKKANLEEKRIEILALKEIITSLIEYFTLSNAVRDSQAISLELASHSISKLDLENKVSEHLITSMENVANQTKAFNPNIMEDVISPLKVLESVLMRAFEVFDLVEDNEENPNTAGKLNDDMKKLLDTIFPDELERVKKDCDQKILFIVESASNLQQIHAKENFNSWKKCINEPDIECN